MATVHATYLAEELGRWLDGAVTEHDALAAYHQRRNEMALEQYERTTDIASNIWQVYERALERAAAAAQH
jgi:hypothetical protein